MQKVELVIGVIIIVAVGVSTHRDRDFDVTESMVEYLQLYQTNYEAKVKKCEDMLADFRQGFAKELSGIDLQKDLLKSRVQDAWSQLKPFEFIDSWHRQCVRNYSSVIPSTYQAGASMTECLMTANTYFNGIESSAKHICSSIKSQATHTFGNHKRSCQIGHRKSQADYNNCIKKSISSLDMDISRLWSSFHKHLDEADFSAKTRIRMAWVCAFNTLYTTSNNLGSSMRLINDCIAGQRSCGIMSCTSRCANQMRLDIRERDFKSLTIKNPFHGGNKHMGCMELRFK
ncbi:uncharacterized protein Dana_GF11172 [Drosophila ananassae]|uniref:Protein TsetseEP domain-containing protein n=1 Tax=Drosophila ananassae TaxID=7217 RepID=B3MHC8_DROAN|nr:uncharacterized protein LOC6494036 [Drosophila ananassae]EDV37928.2 uncharacterized protein Dana_GF11172 [Drosophila ananassae]